MANYVFTTRWPPRRKAAVILAVQNGTITAEEVWLCWRITHARSRAIQFDPMHKLLTAITLAGAAFLLSTTTTVNASWRCTTGCS
jgi:hypothetical protein